MQSYCRSNFIAQKQLCRAHAKKDRGANPVYFLSSCYLPVFRQLGTLIVTQDDFGGKTRIDDLSACNTH